MNNVNASEEVIYSGWCLPTKINVLFGIISTIKILRDIIKNDNKTIIVHQKTQSTKKYQMYTFLSNSCLYIATSYLLYYLCRKGKNKWAWIVFFIKYISSLFFAIFIYINYTVHSLNKSVSES